MNYIIEKNIPVPTKGGSKTSHLQNAIRLMELGDSILLAGMTVSTLSSVVQCARINNPGFKFSQRRVEGGSRLWRIV